MKALPLIACVILMSPCDIRSAPPEADKTQPAVSAKPNLRFMAYDRSAMKGDKEMSYQINFLNGRQRAVFLKMGEIVSGTRFKLTKFHFKTRKDPQGQENDVSEVTLENIDTKEAIVLVLEQRQRIFRREARTPPARSSTMSGVLGVSLEWGSWGQSWNLVLSSNRFVSFAISIASSAAM